MLPVRQRIHGVEALRDAAWASDLSTVQLARGEMNGELLHAVSGQGSVSIGRFDRAARAQGQLAPPGHVAFGLLLEVGGASIHWGSEGGPGDVGVVPGGGEHDAVHHGAVSYLALTLPIDRIAVEGDERPELLQRVAGPRMFEGAAWARAAARETGQRVARALHRNPFLWTSESSRGRLLEEVSQRVFDVVCSGTHPRIERSSGAARHLVNRVEEFVSAHPGTLRVEAIAEALGVRRHTLHRAFLEHLGQPPGRYLLRRRLSLVRESLSCRETDRVSEVAQRNGFWDLGRFAGQYKQLFGELPSETRSRSLAG